MAKKAFKWPEGLILGRGDSDMDSLRYAGLGMQATLVDAEELPARKTTMKINEKMPKTLREREREREKECECINLAQTQCFKRQEAL